MEKQFFKNRFSVNIVKCCASCIHNAGVVNEMQRVCDAGEGRVRLSDLCGMWVMKPYLDNAGKGGGKVKKRHYLYYALENDKDKNDKQLPVKEKRAQYNEKFGSIYL